MYRHGLAALTLVLSGWMEAGCKTLPTTDGGSGLQGVELKDESSLVLGPLVDDRLKLLFYQALEGTLRAQDGSTEDQVVSTELGDLDTFRFTLMRLTKADEDISGDPRERPDGLDVEVTGWYKRMRVSREGGRPQENCVSFDTHIAVGKVGNSWQLKDKIPLSLGREDAEDCY